MADEVSPGGALDRLLQELKNERIKRHMSIDDMSRFVNVSSSHIEKLEAGDFSFLPPLYVFSIVKKYAGEVGIGDEQLLALCRAELHTPAIPALASSAASRGDEHRVADDARRSPAHRSRIYLFIALLVLLSFAALLYYFPF